MLTQNTLLNSPTKAKKDTISVIKKESQRRLKVESDQTQNAPQMKKTLSLTGLTINAMALIAPGAFLWLNYQTQAAQIDPSGASTAPDISVSYTHLRAHETDSYLVCR